MSSSGRKVWPTVLVRRVELRVTMSLSVWGAIIRLVFLLELTKAGTFVVTIGMFSVVVLRRPVRLVRVGHSLALENRMSWFSCVFLVS